MHRVDRDPADAEILVEVLVGRYVAATALHAHLHVELAVVGHRRNVRIGLEDFDVGIGLDVASLDLTWLVDPQIERLGGIDVHLQGHLFQVEDDVGRVLDNARDGRELVEHTVNLDRRHRGAFNRRQQHAAQRVADRRAESALERLRIENDRIVRSASPVRTPAAWAAENLSTTCSWYLSDQASEPGRPPDLHLAPRLPPQIRGRLRAGSTEAPSCQLPATSFKRKNLS
jgi:hypothetical protein